MVLRGGDGGVGELRRLLARAAADDDARSAALDAVCERSVFAATVSGGDGLRTLTNAGGQKAMPLFSGKDALEAAAKQFKWATKGGVSPMRELSAREAMQSALEHGVEFVVFDVGAPHCVEFARDEVALMLAAKQARQRPAAASPAKGPPPVAAKPVTNAAAPAKPGTAAASASASANPRKPGGPRVDRRASTTPAAMPAARARNSTPDAERKRAPTPAVQPVQAAAALPTAERARGFTPAPRPAVRLSVPASASARTTPGFALDPGTSVRVSLAAPPAIGGVTASAGPSSSEFGTALGTPIAPAAGLPPIGALAASALPLPPVALPEIDVPASAPPTFESAGSGAPAALESFTPRVTRTKPTGKGAARPPSLTVPLEPEPQIDAATGLGFAEPDALPDIQPRAAPAPAPPAPPAAETMREAPKPAAQEIPVPQAASDKLKQKSLDEGGGRSLLTAAKAFATMLGGGGDKHPASASKDEPVQAAQTNATAEAADAEGAGEEEAAGDAGGALRALEVGLSDAVLTAIADALRAFPEIEWACEVSDGSAVPVVGVRVSLSFTNRVGEIEAALLAAASGRSATVRVLMLHEPALMREARAHGNTFFPWRKRPGRK